jgi:hypothetical protein
VARDRVGLNLALGAIIALAAALRLPDLQHPGLWLDEILSVMHVRSFAIWERTQGPDAGDGPLYHLVLSLVLKATDQERWLRAPFAIAGLASVPMMFLVGRAAFGTAAGLMAALLLTTSPIHVYYSREARPYTLLLLWFLIGLLAVLPRRETPVPRRRPFYAAMLLLLLTGAHSIFYGCVLLAVFAIALIGARVPVRAVVLELALAAVVVAGGFLLMFASYLGADQVPGAGAPPFDAPFVQRLLNALASGYIETQPPAWRLWVVLAAAVIGGAVSWRRSLTASGVMASAAVLGFAMPLVSLYVVDHWVNVRYVLLALPGLLILAGCGLSAAAGAVTTRGPWRIAVATAAAAAVVAMQAPVVAEATRSKADWRSAAQLVARRAHPGDLVVTSNDWSRLCLEFHLPRIGSRLEVTSANQDLATAQALVQGRPAAFLVSGGYHSSTEVREWMARHGELFRTAPEGLGIYFYPDRVTYLTTRLPGDELQGLVDRFWNDLNGRAVPDSAGTVLLEGWGEQESSPEGAFRWATAREASFYVPLGERSPSLLEVTLMPFDPLADRQAMMVIVNGAVVDRRPLVRGWRTLAFDLTAAAWQPGVNIVALQFSEIAQPAATIAGSRDTRQLAAAFRNVAVTRSSAQATYTAPD